MISITNKVNKNDVFTDRMGYSKKNIVGSKVYLIDFDYSCHAVVEAVVESIVDKRTLKVCSIVSFRKKYYTLDKCRIFFKQEDAVETAYKNVVQTMLLYERDRRDLEDWLKQNKSPLLDTIMEDTFIKDTKNLLSKNKNDYKEIF